VDEGRLWLVEPDRQSVVDELKKSPAATLQPGFSLAHKLEIFRDFLIVKTYKLYKMGLLYSQSMPRHLTQPNAANSKLTNRGRFRSFQKTFAERELRLTVVFCSVTTGTHSQIVEPESLPLREI
jgi:hypothetical protein